MPEPMEELGKKERRKRQNRRNQQARRKRLAEQAIANGPTQKWVIYSAPATESGWLDKSWPSEAVENQLRHSLQPKFDPTGRFQGLVDHNFLQHTLDEQLLTPISRNNIIRAMIANATYLGLTMAMLQDDIVSPFNTFTAAVFGTAELPPGLQPTTLQKQNVHHPWLDLFPIPSFREALIFGAELYDEEELCHDLFFGPSGVNEHQVGIIIWGESWDPFAYELSEAFLKKWYWLIGHCADIIRSTNHWRSKSNRVPIKLAMKTSIESS